MNALKELFDEAVRRGPVEFDRNAENLHDVAFDVTTAESAIIGIADQLLPNMVPSADQLVVLDKRLMEGNVWLLIDGGDCDLTMDGVLLRHAHLLVSMQQECLAYLKAHRGN